MPKKGHATGLVRVQGDAGTKVPKGTKLKRRGDGAEFVTVDDVTVGASEEAQIEVEAIAAGDGGGTAPGSVLEFVKPIENIEDEADVGPVGLAVPGSSAPPAPPAPPDMNVAPALASAKDGPRCHVHMVVNGVGKTRVVGFVLGKTKKGMRVRANMPFGGAVELEDVPEFDPAKPNELPSVELID